MNGKGNLLSQADIEQLTKIAKDVETNPSLFFVCLTGTGNSFCSGADLNEIINDTGTKSIDNYFKSLDILLLNLFSLSKPLIAMVNGHSIGAGLLLQSTADAVVLPQNEKIKLGLPELKLAMTLDTTMCHQLEFHMTKPQLIQTADSGELFGVNKASGFLNAHVNHDPMAYLASVFEIGSCYANSGNGFIHFKNQVRSNTLNLMAAGINQASYLIFSKILRSPEFRTKFAANN